MTIYITIRCNIAMSEQPQWDVSGKFSWWCPQCKTRKTIRREGSFSRKSHMTLQQWLLLIYLWAREYPMSALIHMHQEQIIVLSSRISHVLFHSFLPCRGERGAFHAGGEPSTQGGEAFHAGGEGRLPRRGRQEEEAKQL